MFQSKQLPTPRWMMSDRMPYVLAVAFVSILGAAAMIVYGIDTASSLFPAILGGGVGLGILAGQSW